MAKVDGTKNSGNKENRQGQSGKNKENQSEKKNKESKSAKKDGKKETEYKPGMSYLYDPCPHRVWTPKPGERDKGEPRGLGSPWYEPVRKKEDVDKEEAEKQKKKDEKAKQKRAKAKEKREKEKEEEEKKNKEKEEEKKKKKEEKQKEKEKRKREKDKERKEQEKKKKKEQEKKRQEEKEKKKQQEEEDKKSGKKKKEKPPASYFYDPCPHKVYTPAPGETDLADPKGITSPWYEPVKKKGDIEEEEKEKQTRDNEKRKKERKKREKERKEKEEKEEEERWKEVDRLEKIEKRREARRQKRKKEILRKRQEEDRKHEEMGAGVRDSKTDFTPELMFMMDFISDVDERERERRGEDLRWKKEEIEEKIVSHLAKEAFTNDFKEFVSTLVEAEWLKADKTQRKCEKIEKKTRKEIFKNMDPLAKEMMDEGLRFKTLCNATLGKREKINKVGKPNSVEDLVVGMIMQQMGNMAAHT